MDAAVHGGVCQTARRARRRRFFGFKAEIRGQDIGVLDLSRSVQAVISPEEAQLIRDLVKDELQWRSGRARSQSLWAALGGANSESSGATSVAIGAGADMRYICDPNEMIIGAHATCSFDHACACVHPCA